MDIKMRKIIVLASIVIILIFGVEFVFKVVRKQTTRNLLPPPTITNANLKTFKSSNVMDFTIQVPRDCIITERMGSVTINSLKGSIYIDRNATNYDNLDNYILNSGNNLKDKLKNRQGVVAGDLQKAVGFVGDEKVYFIYTDNIVFSMTTRSRELYSDLDQIAQSFQYTP
jgi:hypothetical protein